MTLRLPARMTQTEVEAYRAQGYDILPGRETPSYRPEWGDWEAIRDIVQNSLDETEQFFMRSEQGAFVIGDDGAGFNVPALLLGQPKPKPDHLRGRFGEGLKIAVLAMLRGGTAISFDTVGLEGAGVLMDQTLVGVKATTLTFVVRRNNRRRGTVWTLWGYGGFLFRDRFTQNLTPPDAIVPSLAIGGPIPRYDSIWNLTGGRGAPETGAMYARDIYMGRVKSPFAYNLWGFKLAPDRHAPADIYDFQQAIGAAWSGVSRVDMVKGFLSLYLDGVTNYIETEVYMASLRGEAQDRLEKNAAVWRQAAREVFSPNMVISTDPRLGESVAYLGGNAVTLPAQIRDWLAQILPTDKAYIAEKGRDLRNSIEITKDFDLAQTAFLNLQMLRAVNKLMPVRTEDSRRPLVSASAIGEEGVAGYWDEQTFTIGIKNYTLDDARSAMDIYIHEYAHYFTRAGDASSRHTLGISLIGAYIVELFATGQVPAIVAGTFAAKTSDLPRPGTKAWQTRAR